MRILPLLVSLLYADAPISPSHGSVIPIEQVAASSTLGTCVGSAGEIDFQRIMFLENTSLVIDGSSGSVRISIDGESLIATEIATTSEGREYFSNIDSLVDPNDDLDLLLKLAYSDKGLLVYWRETFRNRIYRQGLLRVNPTEFFRSANTGLTKLCEGRGGKHSEP